MRDAPANLPHGVPPVAISNRTTMENPTGSWKCIRPLYQDRVAPCMAACPVGIDIEGYMNLLREGRLSEARDLLLRENPMPAVTGRVCAHPCELRCNRRAFDEPVAIHAIERALGDERLEEPLPPRAPRTRAERVAIVGSGPAGLSCAYQLARLGLGVTVFEGDPEPGGILRYGIPEYRLPRRVLEREVERIIATGVELRTAMRVGSAGIPWDSLSGFAAVFLATGAPKSRRLSLAGDAHPAVRSGLGYLRAVSMGQKPDLGKRVLVIGGGNTAIDCARTALRLGSEVTVLYRRSRAEMPAIAEEVADAEREGVRFMFLVAPEALRGRGDALEGLHLMQMQLSDPDESGRRRPVPVDGSGLDVPGDAVLSAIGEDPDADLLTGIERDGSGLVRVDELCETTRTSVFAGGDLVAEPRTVAHALGAGKRAAIAIDAYLRGVALPATLAALRYGGSGNVSATRYRSDDPLRRINPQNDILLFERCNVAHFARVPRSHDRHVPREAPPRSFREVNLGLPPEALEAEASRCFNCGVCNGCELCLIYCPDAAIARNGNGRFVVDDAHCKGCGVCAAECPRGAITMVPVGG